MTQEGIIQTVISIHAPTRGATAGGEGDPWGLVISIHAPTRGATLLPFQHHTDFHISIHAPTRGATSSKWHFQICVLFQSTLPQGERPPLHSGTVCIINISIHAPTRGATNKGFQKALFRAISIHAPTRGATEFKSECDRRGLFQSTLPQGERLPFCLLRNHLLHFNPRSHKGSDSTISQKNLFIQ